MTSDPLTGDELLPNANMVCDHRSLIDATPEEIWPWLVQLGKQRAGWYLPERLERVLPKRNRAIRYVDGQFQNLAVGDRIPDYGGSDEWLEVALLDPPVALVYRAERRGRPFTWALLLHATASGQTELQLRFRGSLRSQGMRRRVIIATGGFLDWLTGAWMVQGLRQRLGD